ncbi:transferrin-binding protein-like solute binding protein [Pelagibacterium montanilacus]|uniref:transferrin-binding protein-like solute binding protein n=1 Tax=Pelagibacterium montanilacus TaxID=2185280 RepID=UPI000F8C6D28|nr:transferrin-binding protein-like solute binding protein [Pelagibacterium montanilacus]
MMGFGQARARLLAGAGLAALMLSGCATTGTGSGGGDEEPPVAQAGGLAATGTSDGSNVEFVAGAGSSATISLDDENDTVTMAFSDGGLDGRTIIFEGIDGNNGKVTAGLDGQTGLQGDENFGTVTALFDEANASFAGVVELYREEEGDIFPGDAGTAIDVYALYGASPVYTGEHTVPQDDQATYAGSFQGYGTNGTETGSTPASIEIVADFGSGGVTGSLTNIETYYWDAQEQGIVKGQNIDDVAFEGTMSQDKRTYAGTNVTIGGEGSGSFEGAFYGLDAAETAGALFATDGTSSVIGGFQADRNDP